jgi:hypothetical protein
MGSTAKSTAPTFVDIWQTLSAVNVEDFVQDKMGLRYLSWANSWIVLMDHYPQAIMDFGANEMHEDGTVTVHCTIVIDTYARHMWLPVMDHRGRAIVRPDARAISDNKMRCMVKCLALFGLGLYIYAGEDLPSAEKDTPKSTPKPTPAPVVKEAAKPKPVATEEESASTPESTRVASEEFVGAMGQFIDMMTTEEGLVGYWNDNRGQITTIQNQHADLYKKMVEMFTNRKAAILKGETKDA